MSRQLFPLLQESFIAFFLALVFMFYLWTASSSGNPFTFGRKLPDYYNLLSDAFLTGQLSLLVEPSKELLALPDPYDPAVNAKWRLHDASLYQGKYYLYFGPTPALTLFIPYRFIFAGDLPENFAAAVLCFGGLLWSLVLLRLLIKAYFPGVSFWIYFMSVFCLSFCNVAPFLLRRPIVYEVAISFGYFFLFGGLYWLVSWELKGEKQPWRLVLGSLFLGLAVGSRIHYVFAAIFLFLPWVGLLRNQHCGREGGTWKELCWVFFPFSVCVSLLLLYNYARFGSWIEFGGRYQLAGAYMPAYQFFAPFRILPGLYFYFLAPSHVSIDFPFFHLAPVYPWSLPPSYLGPEPVAGILTNMPLLNLLWVTPLVAYRIYKSSSVFLGLLLGFFTLLGLAFVLFMSVVLGATMRYEMDFVNVLLLSAIVTWLYLDRQFARKRITKLVLRLFFIASIIYGVLFNIAISFTGYYDTLKFHNPDVYRRLEKACVPLQWLAARYFVRDWLLSIENPNGLERTSSGEEFFWIGRGDTVIKLVSDRAGTLMLGGHFFAGPSLPETPVRRVLVSTDSGYAKEEVFTGESDGLLVVPIGVGVTKITLRSLDTPTVARLPNGDTRPVLLGIKGLHVEKVLAGGTELTLGRRE